MDALALHTRHLFDEILEDGGSSVFADVLMPWVDARGDLRDWLAAFRVRAGDPIPPWEMVESWRLYALSRVQQVLVLDRQPVGEGGMSWHVPKLQPDEYESFLLALGFTITTRMGFSPFDHEIVKVDPAPQNDEPITIVEFYWPAVVLGPLLFARAGVGVRGGRNHVRKEIAEHATMQWAYARRNRPCFDLSSGWGSNSQWRTPHRRDYRIDGMLYFNVDGEDDILAPHYVPELDKGLSPTERLELLQHRSFLTSTKQHVDRSPYWGFCIVPDA